MKLLTFRQPFERIEKKLISVLPNIEPVLLEEDGTFCVDGAPVDVEQVAPDIAWASTDLLTKGPVREFMIGVLKSPQLRWLHTSSAGVDHPVFDEILGKGVRLTTSHMTSVAIGEFVLASVLDAFQPMAARRASQKQRQWQRHAFREIWRSNWVIIGFGAIGQEVAKRAAAFDAHIVGVRRSAMANTRFDIVVPDQLPQVLPDADIVVVSTPLTDQTRHMVDAEFLSALKPGSIFVNVGRGGLVDEPALLASLDQDRPGLAILDVFETEPLPTESPFWHHPKVRVNPHAASFSEGTVLRNDDLFVQNLQAFLAGAPLPNEVKPK